MTPVPLPDSPESIDALYLALLLSEFRGRATEVGDIKIVPLKRGNVLRAIYTPSWSDGACVTNMASGAGDGARTRHTPVDIGVASAFF
jgi:hypothetical protein